MADWRILVQIEDWLVSGVQEVVSLVPGDRLEASCVSFFVQQQFFLVAKELVVVGGLVNFLLQDPLGFLCLSLCPPPFNMLKMGLDLCVTHLAKGLMGLELDGELIGLLFGVGVVEQRLGHSRPFKL